MERAFHNLRITTYNLNLWKFFNWIFFKKVKSKYYTKLKLPTIGKNIFFKFEKALFAECSIKIVIVFINQFVKYGTISA